MHGFWDNLPRPFFVLAPMADVTDVPFRSVIARCGRPDVFYTEFVSARGLASDGRERLLRDLTLTDTDHPIVAQFFGTRPQDLLGAGRLARELGFDGVDINMGCPDRSIMKQGAGAALIGNPELASELIRALREGFGGPTSVKTRLGRTRTDEMDAWLGAVCAAGPDTLIIHGRTVTEMSKVPAHWDLIGRAAVIAHDAGVNCVGNGDIVSREQGAQLAAEHGVDGIMVGRGIFHDPWIFGAATEHTPRERLSLLLHHADLWERHWQGMKSFDLMRKFIKVYVSGWAGAAELRAALMSVRDADALRAVISQSGMMDA